MKFLPHDLYAQVEQSVPLACVDFVPVREGEQGREFGLIQRDSPFGVVWCHLGGRIGRGESIREALLHHADDTLRVSLVLDDDPQPNYVYQWFPPADRPADPRSLQFGDGPGKHAIALTFVARILGSPAPRNQAQDFRWFHGWLAT